MAKTVSTLLKETVALAETIETLDFNDRDAWLRVIEQLGDLTRHLPKKRSDTGLLFDHCRRSLQALLEGGHRQHLKVIEAVTDALYASESYLADGPDREMALEKTIRDVIGVLNVDQPSDKATAAVAAGSADAPVTLNDVAAMMVQLEPDDTEGIHRLETQLNVLIHDDCISDACRRQLRDALNKVTRLSAGDTAGDAEDAAALWAQIGESIETALERIDDPSPETNAVQTAPPATDPVAFEKPPAEAVEDAEEGPGAVPAAECPADGPNYQTADDEKNYMPEDADPDLLGEFIAEGNDLIAAAEEALLSLEVDPEDMEAVGKVFRAFHTVKGTSAFMELNLISELGHHAESLLSRVRDREIRYAGGYADLSLRALDMIKDLIAAVQAALCGNPLLKPKGYDELVELLAAPEAHGISDETDEVASPRIGEMLVAQGKVSSERVESVLEQNPGEQLGTAMIKSGDAKVTDVGQALRAQKRIQATQQAVDTSVRVSTQRLDRLIDMVGELVIAHSMVAQDDSVINNGNHDLQKKVSHASKIVRELQDISMSLRMVPLKATFNKMARLVRDVSRKIGKSVNFITEGEDTEIDRNLVDIISDPLVHMVRNAVDHGIEPPDVRLDNGKPRQGEVQLAAYHSAGSVVVEIRDDGKGLDREGLLAKARERGLIDGDSDQLGDREVYNLIFEPGFSTAQTVTDVSGRGVGMDVVKRNIESLRGQVEIRSELGRGSVFKMSLPLTLAIIDGMAVRVGSETYVIPTVSIVSTLKPEVEDLSTVLKRGEMLSMQGSLIPLFRIANLYQIDSGSMNEAQPLIVVVEDDERQAGLIIDELIGRQQVVIKSLGETMRNIPGISGGAILPNGRVGLILDIGELLKYANRNYEKDRVDPVETTHDVHVPA